MIIEEELWIIDHDDTLVNTMTHHNHYNNKINNKNFKYDDLASFELEEVWGISEVEFWIQERKFYESPYVLEVKPLPGAYEAMEHFKKVRKHVVTGRGKDVQPHSLYSLATHFQPYHFEGVHHTGPEKFGFPRERKIEVGKKLGATLAIDDYEQTLIHFALEGIPCILFTQPWNKNITDLPKLITRVENWYQAVEEIEKIKK